MARSAAAAGNDDALDDTAVLALPCPPSNAARGRPRAGGRLCSPCRAPGPLRAGSAAKPSAPGPLRAGSAAKPSARRLCCCRRTVPHGRPITAIRQAPRDSSAAAPLAAHPHAGPRVASLGAVAQRAGARHARQRRALDPEAATRRDARGGAESGAGPLGSGAGRGRGARGRGRSCGAGRGASLLGDLEHPPAERRGARGAARQPRGAGASGRRAHVGLASGPARGSRRRRVARVAVVADARDARRVVAG
jgi:hypothetical protein